MTLHRIWIAITALAGMPVAGLGLLLVVPGVLHRSPATILTLVPLVLVIWASMLFVQLGRPKRGLSFVRGQLFAFYLLTGGVCVWATTWELSRDGDSMQLFSPWVMIAVSTFFLVPFLHLLLSKQTTEPDASPDGGQAASGDGSSGNEGRHR